MIVPMERVLIAGPQSILEPCLKLLHSAGAVHIADSRNERMFSGAGLTTGTSGWRTEEQTQKAESLLSSVRTALVLLELAYPGRKDLLVFNPSGQDWLSPKFTGEIETVCNEISRAAARQRAIESELEKIRIYRNLFEELRPLVETASSLRSVEASGFVFRGGAAGPELEAALRRATGGTHIWLRGATRDDYTPMLLVYPASARGAVQSGVFGGLGGRIQTLKVPPEYEKETFAQTITALFTREQAAIAELDGCCGNLKQCAVRWTALLRTAERGLDYTIKKLRLQNFLAASGRAFWLSGWVPQGRVEDVRQTLNERFGRETLMLTTPPAPNEYPEVPVLLENRPWAKPFERLLEFFPPPVYGSVDPSAFMAFFFPLFFGVILGDLGYALVLFLLARFIRLRRGGVPVWHDVSAIMYACAASSALFGLLYGEMFGGLLGGFLPSALDRKHDVLPMLAGVLALGAAHLITGKIIGGVNAIRKGYYRHGFGHITDIVIMALIGWAAFAAYTGGASVRGALIATALLVFAKAAVGGLHAFLETFKLASNILSYARLMALGMASLMLADVADRLFTLAGGGFWGVVFAVTVHLANFTLGLLSPAIQSLRLHLVEFFNQFFRQGSVRFAPFGAR